MQESSQVIMTNNLGRQYALYAKEYEEKAVQVLRTGWYVLGSEGEQFEKEWAEYTGAKYCAGLACGLDALRLSFQLLGIQKGDEVIVCANAYIACVMGITMNGARPVFVEPDAYDNIDADKIEDAVTPHTKAVLAVHLYGQCCDMTKIMEIAHRHHLKVVEDCAQSHGNHWMGKKAGTFGDIGCFSFYPTKGCGAFGDAGAVITDDEELIQKFRIYRNYGSSTRYQHEAVGINSRLDELQAGLLRVKLKHLDELNSERVRIAHNYLKRIKNPCLRLPAIRPGADSSWHQFVLHVPGCRDELAAYLKENGIQTLIHYPVPPHLSKAYRYLGFHKGDYPAAEKSADEVLSIPIYNGMYPEETDRVADAVNAFRSRNRQSG